MPKLPENFPKAYRPLKMTERDAGLAYPYIENGVVVPIEDTPVVNKGREWLPWYVRKVEGMKKPTNGYDAEDYFGLSGDIDSGFMFYDTNIKSSLLTNKSSIIFNIGTKIFQYLIESGVLNMLRDLADDSITSVEQFSGCQLKRYGYISLGNASGFSTNKWYRFDMWKDTFGTVDAPYGVSITAVTNYAGTAQFSAAGHLLKVGDTVGLMGMTNYTNSGNYRVIEINPGTFVLEVKSTGVDVAYNGNDTGSVYSVTQKMGTSVTVTELDKPAVIAAAADRIVSVPSYIEGGTIATSVDGSDVQYSEIVGNTTVARVDSFAVTAPYKEAGTFSGVLTEVRAVCPMKQYTALFEVDRITFHKIRPIDEYGTGLIKDDTTHIEELTLDGFGVVHRHSGYNWRKRLFYVDPANGVYEYNTDSRRNQDLTEKWKDGFFKYTTTEASIIYDPRMDCLYVACKSATSATGNHDTVLIYSFRTRMWSVDNGKAIRLFLYDKYGKKVYGLGADAPKIYEVYAEGVNNNLNQTTDANVSIVLKLRSKYFEGGETEKVKEYIDSSVRVMFENASQTFKYKKFFDDDQTASSDDTINCSDLVYTGTPSADRYFKRHEDDELLSRRFERMAIEIEEDSQKDFAVFIPKINVRPTFETFDDSITDKY